MKTLLAAIFIYNIYFIFIISICTILQLFLDQVEVKKSMLSRDCGGCTAYKECSKRYRKAKVGDKVYCADGTVHLIDCTSMALNPEFFASKVKVLTK